MTEPIFKIVLFLNHVFVLRWNISNALCTMNIIVHIVHSEWARLNFGAPHKFETPTTLRVDRAVWYMNNKQAY